MIGNRLFIFFFLITLIFPSYSDSISVYYEEGLSAYQNGQYNLAVQKFESILSLEWESSELYYNLGNSFFRLGDIANSIWAYESCLKLSPTHSDARYNLQLVNLKVVDKIELPDSPFYLFWYQAIKESFTSNEWINISLLIFLLYSIFSTFNRLRSNKYLQSIIGVVLSTFVVSLLLTLNSIWIEKSTIHSIVMPSKVDVRSEPNKYSTRLFEVHKGLKLNVKKIEAEWVEIELLDGKSGWVEIKFLKKVI